MFALFLCLCVTVPLCSFCFRDVVSTAKWMLDFDQSGSENLVFGTHRLTVRWIGVDCRSAYVCVW